MPRFQLRMRCRPRDPLDDDGEGRRLRELVVGALGRGGAPVAGVVVRTDRLDLADLQPIREAGIALPMFLAAMTRSTAVGAGAPEAVGLIGAVPYRTAPSEAPVPMAVAFLEWADCRWWMWRALVDPDGRGIREDTEVVTRAIDGDPLPPNLGRWWSLGRRTGARIDIGAPTPPAASAGAPLVH